MPSLNNNQASANQPKKDCWKKQHGKIEGVLMSGSYPSIEVCLPFNASIYVYNLVKQKRWLLRN